ncbi:MAG: ZIP family metal transporter [Methanomassiliicoccaceae archaeon]|nr:ZIP family metal transporter [Methanomassiliicoccaceae archaeon]
MFDGLDPYMVLLIFVVMILIVSAAAMFLPRMMKLDMRQIHLLVALSAGIFLGILFFMLIPETFHEAHDREMDAAMWIVGGFMVVLFIDVIVKRMHMNKCACDDCVDKDHLHEVTSLTAFIGLAIHAVVDGVVIAIAISAGESIAAFAIAGIALHKFADVFALSSIFTLTNIDKKKTFVFMIIFVLITPLAAIASMPLVDTLSDMELFIPLALATGIFMYVGIYSLLPEAFHERRDSIKALAIVVIGVVAIALLAILFGDAHGH